MSVYFIGARDLDLVKIGYAFNPVSRLRSLQVACPMALTLEGAIPGGFDKEAELHRKYEFAWVRGEWFKMCPNLQREIDHSSRPDKFNWAHVRIWLQNLEKADEELARQKVPQEVLERAEQQIQERFAEAARRSRLTAIERLAEDGHIYFPFRTKEIA